MAKLVPVEVAELIAGKINDNKAAIRANSSAITTINTAIETLNGTGEGSVDKKVSDAIDAVVDGAPATFDTLKELADWISDDQTGAASMSAAIAANQSSITTLQTALSNLDNEKVDKVEGKALSTNDYDDTEKASLKAAQSSITVLQAAVDALEHNTGEAYTLVTVSEANAWFS